MGLVMQEPTLFNYSIRDNILYGMPNASNAEIRDAVKVANAVEFIEGSVDSPTKVIKAPWIRTNAHCHHRFLHSFSFLQMAWDILLTLLEAV